MKNKKKVSVSKSSPKEVKKIEESKSPKTQSHKIQPLGDRILVRPFAVEEVEKKNSFGIIIPETVTKEQPEQGLVLAVGEGRYQDGAFVPMKVKVGDTVIFSKYGFDLIKVEGDELYILREDSILAVIN